MSFVSFAFAALLGLTLVAYHLAHRSIRAQNAIILAASLVFYGWFDWAFLGLFLFAAAVNYAAAIGIEDLPRHRRLIAATAIVGNLALLCGFKYLDFFAASTLKLLQLFGLPEQSGWIAINLVLPLGISFFVFQKIAYVVDVYRGEVRAERSFPIFLCFVLFFPQLVAGPIERADHLMPQFKRARFITSEAVSRALWLICWGLFLKIAVADSLAPLVDNAFRLDQQYGWSVILGTVAFGIQIYGDFAGYSFMAKGFAALLGFELVWNFARPYFSTSVQEFWQRWHITLGRWLRDYLYIPLGGNRRGELRTEANLLITMTLGGLWHGASWSFVAWGLFHGLALSAHRAWHVLGFRLPVAVAWALTMVVVFTGWFLFRAQTGTMALALLGAFADLGWRPGHSASALMIGALAAPVVLVETLQHRANNPYAPVEGRPWLGAVLQASAIIATLALIGNVRSQFVYFQF